MPLFRKGSRRNTSSKRKDKKKRRRFFSFFMRKVSSSGSMKTTTSPSNVSRDHSPEITLPAEAGISEGSNFERHNNDDILLRRCWTDLDEYRNINRGYVYSAWTLNGDDTDWKTSTSSLQLSKNRARWFSTVEEVTKTKTVSRTRLETKREEVCTTEEFIWASDVIFDFEAEPDQQPLPLVGKMKRLSVDEKVKMKRLSVDEKAMRAFKSDNEMEPVKSMRRRHTVGSFKRLIRRKKQVKTTTSPRSLDQILEEEENNSHSIEEIIKHGRTSETPCSSIPRNSLTFAAVDQDLSGNQSSNTSSKRPKGRKRSLSLNGCFGQGGAAALLRAAKNNSTTQCKALIDRGISTEVVDPRGWSPLLIALENDNFECAELFVEHGANLDFRNIQYKKYILHEMVSLGKYKALEFLLSRGANPNVTDAACWPPIHYAFMGKRLKCAALLLSFGADAEGYTDKRVDEYKQCVRVANEGIWKFKWNQKLDIDYDTQMEL